MDSKWASSSSARRRGRPRLVFHPVSLPSLCLMFLLSSQTSLGFAPPSTKRTHLAIPSSAWIKPASSSPATITTVGTTTIPSSSTTALHVWWFGGIESSETLGEDDESCELVAVRIERTSANSRRIAGDITVPVPLESVWDILTDYNHLATHVPNVVESRIISTVSRGGRNGDGTFQCKLYQKGAQKIVGFEFGASLTMEMKEQIVSGSRTSLQRTESSGEDTTSSLAVPQQRKINFKCIDSQFFSGFDGDWTVTEQIAPDGTVETLVSYVVDVRPKGPVPVAALEWRIREDVPTNLRSIKAASLKYYQQEQYHHQQQGQFQASVPTVASRTSAIVKKAGSIGKRAAAAAANGVRKQQRLRPAVISSSLVDWDRDETMAKYLDK